MDDVDDDERDAFDDEYAGFDTSGEEEDTTLPCPVCGEAIYDDAERCPACGHYLSREDSQPANKPLWIVFGALLCLLIVILWAVWGGFV
jgi:predicted nucleic acid-binding Zn ribbon protein